MRKNILLLALLACTLAYGTPVQIGKLYYELNVTTATVVRDQSGAAVNYATLDTIIIPGIVTYGGHDYTVTAIDLYAFRNCTDLIAVSIPSSVETVGNAAFQSCVWLDSVAWHPVKLTAGYATNTHPFYNCKKITKFTFGPDVQRIPSYLCYEMAGITSVTFPDGLKFIGNYAFAYMTGISQIVLPEGFNQMGSGIFSGCSNLASIRIPSSLSTIGDSFCNGTALTELTLPESVVSIGSEAFMGTQLTSVTISEGVTAVGNRAFAATKITSVVWNAVNAISGSATNTHPFYNSPLKSITFGKDVTTIPSYLCYDQKKLEEIYNYATKPQTIQANVFFNVSKSTCALYVPKEALEAYQAKAVWQDFANMVGTLSTLKYTDAVTTISYLGQQAADTLHQAPLMLRMPVAPMIDGYTFLKWEVLAGDFEDGIVLQAVYESDNPTGSGQIVQRQSSGRKLIQRGNVYVLRDDALFTVTGQKVK